MLISCLRQRRFIISVEIFKQILILVGNKVKELRQKRNMTIKELSEKSGISQKYLKKIENGQAIGITTKHIDRLCRSLDLSSINDILYFY